MESATCARCQRVSATADSAVTDAGTISGLQNLARYARRCGHCRQWFCGECSFPKFQALQQQAGLSGAALMEKLEADYWRTYPNSAPIFSERPTCPLCGRELGAASGSCFIATAAMESPSAPEVEVLRAFRDDVLLRSAPGAACVRGYVRWSPPCARWLASRPRARRIVRTLVIRPVAAACARLTTRA